MTSGFQGSDMIILAARPSMGKTALALNIARNAAVDGNVAVAVFSLEMSKEQLCERMLCAEARVDSNRLRGGFLNPDDWNRITEAASVLSEAPLYIDDSPDISATSIRTKSRRLKMDKGLGTGHHRLSPTNERPGGHGTARSRDFRDFARLETARQGNQRPRGIALSQLNRKLEERNDKRPKLSDLRESGALEQDADVVAFIYRDEVYNRDENNPNTWYR